MLDNNYKKALKRIRIYNQTILGKSFTKNIEVSIDNLKISCDGIRLGGMLLDTPKGLEESLNAVASMTIKYIEKAFDIPVHDNYTELANMRIWSWQHTIEYKDIREKLFDYAMQGKANKVETMLIKLRECLVDMLDEHWIVE